MTRPDYTRWNRAGLSRFQYVDGNAAVWLHELQLALRDRFSQGGARQWGALEDSFATAPEDAVQRNRRLQRNYDARSEDYAAEIARAFARATHVLMRYVDAYANEGFIRTATQWDMVRKLAATVGYQPLPPASATTTIALIAHQGTGESVVRRGLGMRHTPDDGGPPLVFETLRDVRIHPELNAARHHRWAADPTSVDPVSDVWVSEGKSPEIRTGSVAVLTSVQGVRSVGQAVMLTDVGNLGEGRYALAMAGSSNGVLVDGVVEGRWIRGRSRLLAGPAGVTNALPRRDSRQLWVAVEQPGGIGPGAVVELLHEGAVLDRAVVSQVRGNSVRLVTESWVPSDFEIRQMAAYAPIETVSAGVFPGISRDSGLARMREDPFTKRPHSFLLSENSPDPYFNVRGKAEIAEAHDEDINVDDKKVGVRGKRVTAPLGAAPTAYVTNEQAPRLRARVLEGASVPDVPPLDKAFNASFSGKPPKGLQAGVWFVARHQDHMLALRVLAVTEEEGSYTIHFDGQLPGAPHDTEFHGPMKDVLRPRNWNRNPTDAVSRADSEVTLEELSDTARQLVRKGNFVIVEDERPPAERPPTKVLCPVLATIASVGSAEQGGNLRVTVAPVSHQGAGDPFKDFEAGWTVFRFNTVLAGHGEDKGGRILGSGNGELERQTFDLQVADVSFEPNSAAAAGVEPALELIVDETVWPYRDLLDLSADGSASYSTVINEDSTLQIVFRRRLKTGMDNVRLSRMRVGTGLRGNSVPPLSFREPAKRHRTVSAIAQPFPATGGGPREPAERMRLNAPGALRSNGRAVTLSDYGNIAARHSGVAAAVAISLPRPGRDKQVEIVVVPASGRGLTHGLADSIRRHVETKAAPGVRALITDFSPVRIGVTGTVVAETSSADPQRILAEAVAAIATAFALSKRDLGQTLYSSEFLSVLESVPGVQAATAEMTIVRSAQPVRTSSGRDSAVLRAVFPSQWQVAYVATAVDVELRLEEAR